MSRRSIAPAEVLVRAVVETLEARRLLTVSYNASLRLVTADGNGGNNTITLSTSGSSLVVNENGVNTFIAKEEEKRASFQPDPMAEQRQKAQLEKVKRERDPQVVRDCLAAVRQALLDGGNTIPALVPAIKAYVTIGEICDVMREVYGEYSQPT